MSILPPGLVVGRSGERQRAEASGHAREGCTVDLVEDQVLLPVDRAGEEHSAVVGQGHGGKGYCVEVDFAHKDRFAYLKRSNEFNIRIHVCPKRTCLMVLSDPTA